MFWRALLITGLLLTGGRIDAREIYVDNERGRDANNGRSEVTRPGDVGPVKSLERAIERSRNGDIIVIKKTEKPYYGSISLMGHRNSGGQYTPFTIRGNGATISGLRTLPPGSWEREDRKLWRLTLTRKGYYRLLRDGQILPEFRPEDGLDPRALLQPGHWVAWRGSIYFRQDRVGTPETDAFTYAADQTGISLHQVSHVVISDVVLQHFRFDGIHAQGLCDNVVLDNVIAVENGRAGVVSSGASKIEIFGGRIAGNGRHQLLILDRAAAIPHECDIQEESPERENSMTEETVTLTRMSPR